MDAWKQKDPLLKFRQFSLKETDLTQEDLDAVHQQVVAEIDAAYEFAQNSPEPELSVAFEDVWAD